jgi:hypothetical protein
VVQLKPHCPSAHRESPISSNRPVLLFAFYSPTAHLCFTCVSRAAQRRGHFQLCMSVESHSVINIQLEAECKKARHGLCRLGGFSRISHPPAPPWGSSTVRKNSGPGQDALDVVLWDAHLGSLSMALPRHRVMPGSLSSRPPAWRSSTWPQQYVSVVFAVLMQSSFRVFPAAGRMEVQRSF